MATRKHITRTTIETHEITRIHLNGNPSPGWCPVCNKEVMGLRPNQMAAIRSVPVREIHRQIASGELHAIELANGEQAVCPQGLHNQETRKVNLPL